MAKKKKTLSERVESLELSVDILHDCCRANDRQIAERMLKVEGKIDHLGIMYKTNDTQIERLMCEHSYKLIAAEKTTGTDGSRYYGRFECEYCGEEINRKLSWLEVRAAKKLNFV